MAFNYNEEVICGHLVTAETKKLWAVEMDLARQLLDVCKKHNLKIWADAGTLLGAVRHGGFIPWDDDMDFCMLREDYNVLLEIGPKEFKEPYFFQSFYTDDIGGGLIHIRNSNTTMLEDSYKSYKKRNLGCAIDVFVMDAVPDDLSTFKRQYRKVYFWRRMVNNYKILNPKALPMRSRIFNEIIRLLFKLYDVNKVQAKIVEILSSFRADSNAYLALIDYSASLKLKVSDVKLRKRECYSETIYLSFYDLMIPVPQDYHEILSSWYGNYMTPVKGTQLHKLGYVDCDKPYTQVLDYLAKSK